MEIKGLNEVFPTSPAPVEIKGLDQVFPVETAPTTPIVGLDEVFPPSTTPSTEFVPEDKTYLSTTANLVTDAELQQIAAKHKVPLSLLKSRVGLYGGITEGGELDVKEIVTDVFGRFSESLLASLPQWIDKKLQEPSGEAALEELRTSINQKKSKTLLGQVQDVSTFVLGATAGAKLGDKALGSGFLGTTAQSGLSGLAESKSGEELSGLATGAALGAGFYGIIGSALQSKAIKDVASSIFEPKKYLPDVDVGANLDAKVKGILTETADKNRSFLEDVQKVSYGEGSATDILDSENFGTLIAFSKHMGADITAKDAAKASEQALSWFKSRAAGGEGLPNLLDEAMSFRYKQEARKLLKATVEEEMPEQAGWLKTQFNKLLSADSVFRMADRKWGTNLAVTQGKITEGLRDLTTHLGIKKEEYKVLADKARELKITDDEIYQALDKGINPTDPKKLEVVEAYRKYFSDARDDVNQLGMDIKKRENYIPHVTVEEPVMVNRIKEKAKELNVTEFTKESFKDPKNADLVKALEIFRGEAINSPELASRILKTMNKAPERLGRLKTQSFAAMAREGEIPEFIRETSITKLTNRWLTSTLKHTYLRDGLRELKQVRDSIGDKDISLKTYIEDMLQDVTGGIREGTLAGASRRFAQDHKNKFISLAEQAPEGSKKTGYELAAHAPDILSFFVRQAYSNYLGWNPKALFTNLTQTTLSTVPEIGYRSAAPKLLGAYADLASVFRNGKDIIIKDPLLARELHLEIGAKFHTRDPEKILRNEGILGKAVHSEMRDIMQKGLAESKWVRGALAVDKASTDLSMTSYAYTEVVNRYATYKLSQSIGDDLVNAVVRGDTSSSSKAAIDFLNKMRSPAHRRAITEAINAGKPEVAQKVITEYLIGKTIYNYDKISAAQYARSVGPMMSMFTKFPTAILGDITEVLAMDGAKKGGVELARKYGAPVMLLAGVDAMLWPEGEERTGLAKTLLGKQQPLTGMTPASSVMGVISEGYTPPIVEMGQDALKAAGSMEKEQINKFMESLAKGFVPGAVWYRVYTQATEEE